MAKKKKGSKKTASSGPMAAASLLVEKVAFEADTLDDPIDKNERLADLLQGPWLKFAIVRIERIEIGSQRGWRATHRA